MIMQVFDVKHNGVIEFGEFVCSLGIFHPNAPVALKTECKKQVIILSYTKPIVSVIKSKFTINDFLVISLSPFLLLTLQEFFAQLHLDCMIFDKLGTLSEKRQDFQTIYLHLFEK